MATYISMVNFAKVTTLVESLNSSVDKKIKTTVKNHLQSILL